MRERCEEIDTAQGRLINLMGFLAEGWDLNGTEFGEDHLTYAQGYRKWVIERVDPSWLNEPRGRLGVHWSSDTLPSAIRLIDLARRVWNIAQSITEESHSVLGEKLALLLDAEERQHDELLLEFLVGSILVTLGAQLELEPASVEGEDPRDGGRSVDFAVGDGSDRVFVEATTVYMQRLSDWENAVTRLKRRFEREITNRKLSVQLDITAPLALSNRSFDDAELKQLVIQMSQSQTGRLEIQVSNESMELSWRPLPHLSKPPSDPTPLGGSWAIFGPVEVVTAAGSMAHLRWPGEAEELVLSSLRNTLDQKRRQFKRDAPYLLALERGHSRIPESGIVDLLQRRIFPNPYYQWLLGAFLVERRFSQRTGFNPRAGMLQNPGGSIALPEWFVSSMVSRGS